MTDDWSARIIHGDCVEAMAALDPESVHSVCCDPPYELNFMGRGWDNAGVSFRPETWEAVLRVLKPGGHLLAFGGTRTYHRMAVAIEDAGFEIRDSLHWIYGSGFPKSLDVSKGIDKAAGVEREVTREASRPLAPGDVISFDQRSSTERDDPVTPAATAWQGWGTALKPAHEPIILARKPLSGTVVETVLAHGTGAINVRGCAVGVEGGTRQVVAKEGPTGREATSYGASIGSAPGGNEDAGGRWPANLVLSHLAECEGNGASHTDVLCAPGCPVAELNEMSGEGAAGAHPAHRGVSIGDGNIYGGGGETHSGIRVQLEGGGAARFFYIAKPRRRERIGGTIRNLHPTVKPVDLMRWLVRLTTPLGGIVLDPFAGSGTTGCAAMVEGARFIGIEQDADSHATALARVSDYAFKYGRERPVAA